MELAYLNSKSHYGNITLGILILSYTYESERFFLLKEIYLLLTTDKTDVPMGYNWQRYYGIF